MGCGNGRKASCCGIKGRHETDGQTMRFNLLLPPPAEMELSAYDQTRLLVR